MIPEHGVVEDGLSETLEVGGHGGHPIELRFYENGDVRVKHYCDRSKGPRPDVQPTVVIAAPALVLPPARTPEGKQHLLRRDEHAVPTITPSIQCTDCGLHGHVTDGRWKVAR